MIDAELAAEADDIENDMMWHEGSWRRLCQKCKAKYPRRGNFGTCTDCLDGISAFYESLGDLDGEIDEVPQTTAVYQGKPREVIASRSDRLLLRLGHKRRVWVPREECVMESAPTALPRFVRIKGSKKWEQTELSPIRAAKKLAAESRRVSVTVEVLEGTVTLEYVIDKRVQYLMRRR